MEKTIEILLKEHGERIAQAILGTCEFETSLGMKPEQVRVITKFTAADIARTTK